MQTDLVTKSAQNVRKRQSKLALRKESWTALAVLVASIATLVADNADAIPAEAGVAGQVVVAVCSVVAYCVARFTVPALTSGQQALLEQEAETITAHPNDDTAPAECPAVEGEPDAYAAGRAAADLEGTATPDLGEPEGGSTRAD